MEQEDRDMLIRIDENVKTVVKRLDNHGARLNLLERAGAIATGGIFLAGFLFKWLKFKIISE